MSAHMQSIAFIRLVSAGRAPVEPVCELRVACIPGVDGM